MNDLNDEYRDRGIKKWAGFYLSEHTAAQEKLTNEKKKFNPQKRQMNSQEITTVINEAVLKNKSIAIQIEAVDQNGHYKDDVVGLVIGGDELGIYVKDTKVDFDEIRNIQFISQRKWTDLTDNNEMEGNI
ncbi:hypothetical protein CAR_c11260 [Carnobacterium sp. 17-4]|uniref:hypothetical protein n=1 Tax=Carnobacterium sp. (strain 17-4) TaxID=208596 RepID=UPI000205924C|nr:hypothetical protein [Carnobacterium sp. 17-4]AEB29818.1 hypothetical protein CAR_c11260 [Carnobacterium sp. 17-4]